MTEEQQFRETVLTTLAVITTHLKWIVKIGSAIVLLAGIGFGTLWLRTENNALQINSLAEAATVEMVQPSGVDK